MKLFRRLIYVNQFHKVWKFHVLTDKLGDLLKSVYKMNIKIH